MWTSFCRGLGRLQQFVAAGRHLAEPHTERDHQVSIGDAPGQLGIDADADVAGIEWVPVVESVLKAPAAGHRQLPVFCETLQRRRGFGVPARAACDQHRALGGQQHRAQLAQAAGCRPGTHRLHARQHRRRRQRRQHVLGHGQHPPAPGRPCIAVWKARATYSGTRSALWISATHLARPSVPGLNICR